MDSTALNFIVIDDSKLDCFIAEKLIKNTGKAESVKTFTVATDALEYIKGNAVAEGAKTIVLVDIQMPVMNGFEFVEAFEALPHDLIKNYTVYVLSSSINESDLNRVRLHTSVKQFLNKPLTGATLGGILDAV